MPDILKDLELGFFFESLNSIRFQHELKILCR